MNVVGFVIILSLYIGYAIAIWFIAKLIYGW